MDGFFGFRGTSGRSGEIGIAQISWPSHGKQGGSLSAGKANHQQVVPRRSLNCYRMIKDRGRRFPISSFHGAADQGPIKIGLIPPIGTEAKGERAGLGDAEGDVNKCRFADGLFTFFPDVRSQIERAVGGMK